MAQVTLKSGFDVDYHLGQVGVDYHLTAGGEPPGRWIGRGAAKLGLSGRVGGTSDEGKANARPCGRCTTTTWPRTARG